MNNLIVLGIVIVALGGGFGSYIIYLGVSMDTMKNNEDIKEHVSEKLDSDTINEEAKKNKPQVNILTTTNEEGSYIDITIEVKNTSIKSVAINYPVQGTVRAFNDLNSSTDAESSIKEVQGDAEGVATNNVNLLVKNITPDRKLTYRIFYTPQLKNVFIAGRDRYEVTYKWAYKGNDYYSADWRLVINDELTTKPIVHVKNVTVYDRVLSPEEIKKDFERGVEKRKFE